MTRLKGVILWALALAAAIASGQSYAQGQNPTGLPNALNVNVTNTPLPVTVTNPATNSTVFVNNSTTDPVPVAQVNRNEPFTKSICLTSIVGACGDLPRQFQVPGISASGRVIERLVIEYVAGQCGGSGRADPVFITVEPASGRTIADTGDNFSRNYFPVNVAQYASPLGINSIHSFAQKTIIFASPQSTLDVSFNFAAAGEVRCTAVLSGHFVVQ